MGEIGALIIVALVVLGICLAIAWLVLPFAVIGMKPLMQEMIRSQAEIIRLLRAQTPDPDTHIRCPYCREPIWTGALRCPNCTSDIRPRKVATP